MPNFFILGAAKAGTSFLYHCLRQHPQIYLPAQKELRFFDSDRRFDYGPGLSRYLRTHFRDARGYTARGEATPSYLPFFYLAIPRMMKVYGDCTPQFIVVLRNPVDRAWSHYRHGVLRGYESEPFERALALEEARLRGNPRAWVGYYSDGLYAKQLGPWLDHFPKSRFLIILSDDLRTDPALEVAKACVFLGVEARSGICAEMAAYGRTQDSGPRAAKSGAFMRWTYRVSQARSLTQYIPGLLRLPLLRAFLRLRGLNMRTDTDPPHMSADARRRLRAMYVADIRELESLIGRDLSLWLSS